MTNFFLKYKKLNIPHTIEIVSKDGAPFFIHLDDRVDGDYKDIKKAFRSRNRIFEEICLFIPGNFKGIKNYKPYIEKKKLNIKDMESLEKEVDLLMSELLLISI